MKPAASPTTHTNTFLPITRERILDILKSLGQGKVFTLPAGGRIHPRDSSCAIVVAVTDTAFIVRCISQVLYHPSQLTAMRGIAQYCTVNNPLYRYSCLPDPFSDRFLLAVDMCIPSELLQSDTQLKELIRHSIIGVRRGMGELTSQVKDIGHTTVAPLWVPLHTVSLGMDFEAPLDYCGGGPGGCTSLPVDGPPPGKLYASTIAEALDRHSPAGPYEKKRSHFFFPSSPRPLCITVKGRAVIIATGFQMSAIDPQDKPIFTEWAASINASADRYGAAVSEQPGGQLFAGLVCAVPAPGGITADQCDQIIGFIPKLWRCLANYAPTLPLHPEKTQRKEDCWRHPWH